jgi:predicted Zn-dependent peptidase
VFNAFTSKDYTGYYVKAPARHADQVVDVIADMIQQPNLAEDEIEREKGVIVQEISMYEDTPQRRIFDLYETLLYGNTPLGYDITGSAKSVNSFTKKTFTSYMDSLYHPNNAVLILAGGLSSANNKLKSFKNYSDLADDKFGSWKKKKVAGFEPIEEAQSKPQLLLSYKKSEQAHLCIGYRTFSRFDERRYILSVLSAILGSGMSSRLFIEVRERRGLCYSIGTSNDFYHDAGNTLTYAGVSTDLNKVKETIKVILYELGNLVDKGVSEEEIIRAKELIKGRIILSMEDTFNVADMYGKQMLHEGKLRTVDQTIAKISAVTTEQVQALAKELYIQKHLNLALIGPFKKESEFLDLLK